MKTTARSILAAALRLPEPEQVELATQLLAHLEGANEADVDAAWAAEVERRTREIDLGIVKPIPWSAVKRAAVRRSRAKSYW
jgi:putative addiction module component (TIGR02574 family)